MREIHVTDPMFAPAVPNLPVFFPNDRIPGSWRRSRRPDEKHLVP